MASIPNTRSSSDDLLSDIKTTQKVKPPITTISSGWSRRRIWPLRKRKKLPTVRLGGGKSQPRRGRVFLVRMFTKIRVRWVKLKNACTLKKLTEYYYSVIKDVMEAGGSFETYQQWLLMETSFAIPVMGLSFNTYH